LARNPPNGLDDVPFRYGKFNTTDELWTDADEKRQEIAAYYACISYIDTCVGIMLDALNSSGREQNTIVCLWGGHGMHLGEHGLWRKYTLFENAARVPFLIASPGVSKEGAVCKRPVELIDMYPTLADLSSRRRKVSSLPGHRETRPTRSRPCSTVWPQDRCDYFAGFFLPLVGFLLLPLRRRLAALRACWLFR